MGCCGSKDRKSEPMDQSPQNSQADRHSKTETIDEPNEQRTEERVTPQQTTSPSTSSASSEAIEVDVIEEKVKALSSQMAIKSTIRWTKETEGEDEDSHQMSGQLLDSTTDCLMDSVITESSATSDAKDVLKESSCVDGKIGSKDSDKSRDSTYFAKPSPYSSSGSPSSPSTGISFSTCSHSSDSFRMKSKSATTSPTLSPTERDPMF
jgi:hypothetical protein